MSSRDVRRARVFTNYEETARKTEWEGINGSGSVLGANSIKEKGRERERVRVPFRDD